MVGNGSAPPATPGDVRLWLIALDEALAPLVPKGARRYAAKEARGVIEDLSFRFAFLDDRYAPDDRDLGRALAALKPPARVAEVLARRAPVYRRKRRASLVRTWATLAVLALVVWGFAQLATGDESVRLATVTHSTGEVETGTVKVANFTAPAGLSRIDVNVQATNLDPGGDVVVRLFDPAGALAYQGVFSREARAFDSENLAPREGTWTIAVDFANTGGTVRVDVTGVRPA